MNDETVRQIILSNPHWKGGGLSEHIEKIQPRDALDELRSYLDGRQMVLITGPRRVGKTTAMILLMQELLDGGTDPKRIFYFSFDEILSREHSVLQDVVAYYLDNVHPGKPTRGSPAYLFLDEVQFVRDWPVMLKRLYETVPHVKMFASGSSSLEVHKGMAESLAGRAFDVRMSTLSFREFLQFRGIDIPALPPIGSGKAASEKMRLVKSDVQRNLDDYLVRGGFPEIVDEGSIARVHNYIRQSVLERVVYHDLPEADSVASPASLMHLLRILASISSQRVELANIAPAIGMKPQTASKYLSVLERAHLASICYNYTKSEVKQARSSKKAYLADNGLISSMLGYDESTRGAELGRLAETAAYNHLSRMTKTYFWRDVQGNEVDLVCLTRSGPLPIEVKYQASIYKSDAKGLLRFCNVHGVKRALLVTKDKEGSMAFGDIRVDLLPLWSFLSSSTIANKTRDR
ncbi:MAG TPA: ATP-binding protein [Thermoplasmata archaeon]|nr:ATP-binding protein [Thermoplasmata archaeon]